MNTNVEKAWQQAMEYGIALLMILLLLGYWFDAIGKFNTSLNQSTHQGILEYPDVLGDSVVELKNLSMSGEQLKRMATNLLYMQHNLSREDNEGEIKYVTIWEHGNLIVIDDYDKLSWLDNNDLYYLEAINISSVDDTDFKKTEVSLIEHQNRIHYRWYWKAKSD